MEKELKFEDPILDTIVKNSLKIFNKLEKEEFFDILGDKDLRYISPEALKFEQWNIINQIFKIKFCDHKEIQNEWNQGIKALAKKNAKILSKNYNRNKINSIIENMKDGNVKNKIIEMLLNKRKLWIEKPTDYVDVIRSDGEVFRYQLHSLFNDKVRVKLNDSDNIIEKNIIFNFSV